MSMRGLQTDDRGASIAITHALTLGITAILISTLLVTAGNYLDNQQDRVAQAQLQDVGGDVASTIERADRLNDTGDEVNATFEASYPQQVAGEPYTLALIPDSGSTDTTATLYLNSSELGRSVPVRVETDTAMVESRTRGADPTVRLCSTASGQRIVLGECP